MPYDCKVIPRFPCDANCASQILNTQTPEATLCGFHSSHFSQHGTFQLPFIFTFPFLPPLTAVMAASVMTTVMASAVGLIMTALFQLVLAFGPQEGTGQSADETMTCLVAEEPAADAAGHGSHEASLAFLGVVRVCGVPRVAVGIVRVIGSRGVGRKVLLLLLVVILLLAVRLVLLVMLEAAGRGGIGLLLVVAIWSRWCAVILLLAVTLVVNSLISPLLRLLAVTLALLIVVRIVMVAAVVLVRLAVLRCWRRLSVTLLIALLVALLAGVT